MNPKFFQIQIISPEIRVIDMPGTSRGLGNTATVVLLPGDSLQLKSHGGDAIKSARLANGGELESDNGVFTLQPKDYGTGRVVITTKGGGNACLHFVHFDDAWLHRIGLAKNYVSTRAAYDMAVRQILGGVARDGLVPADCSYPQDSGVNFRNYGAPTAASLGDQARRENLS